MRSIVEVKDKWILLDSLEKAKEQVESLGCIWHDWFYEKVIRPEMSEQYYPFWFMDKNPATTQYVSSTEIVGQVHDGYEGQEPYWLALLYSITDRWKSNDPEKNKKAYKICDKRFSRLMCSIKQHFIPQHFWGTSIIINYHYMRDDYLPILVNAMVEQLNCGSKK